MLQHVDRKRSVRQTVEPRRKQCRSREDAGSEEPCRLHSLAGKPPSIAHERELIRYFKPQEQDDSNHCRTGSSS